MKILLVDDEEELASTLAERLRIRGIDAQWAISAEQAMQLPVQALAQHTPSTQEFEMHSLPAAHAVPLGLLRLPAEELHT